MLWLSSGLMPVVRQIPCGLVALEKEAKLGATLNFDRARFNSQCAG